METLTMYNGNDQLMVKEMPKIIHLGFINDGALAHIEKQTGLVFEKNGWDNYEAQPTDSNQIVRLLLTYNFKTRYYNNGTYHNTLMLKGDHHVGFDVDSICFDCVGRNHIVTNGLKQGDFLSC